MWLSPIHVWLLGTGVWHVPIVKEVQSRVAATHLAVLGVLLLHYSGGVSLCTC